MNERAQRTATPNLPVSGDPAPEGEKAEPSFEMDLGGRILAASEAFSALVGEAIIGRRLRDLFPPEYASTAARKVELLATGLVERLTLCADLACPDGSRIEVVVLLTRVRVPAGIAISGRAAPWADRRTLFPSPTAAELRARLTKREAEAIALLERGFRVDEIAAALGVSAHTVRNHIRFVCKKFGVHSQVELLGKLK